MSDVDRMLFNYEKHEWKEDDIKERIKDFHWCQCIELAPGIVTNGWGPPSEELQKLFDSIGYSGKDVLDIGTLNGMWSFEACKRGARFVQAIDLPAERNIPNLAASFRFCRSVLRANVHYTERSIYTFKDNGYDVVLCFDLLHHIRHPLLALEIIHDSLAPAGNLLLECATTPGDESTCNFYHSVPYMNDPSNRWVPTALCLLEWVAHVGLRVVDHWPGPEGSMRHNILAVKRGAQ